MEHSQIPETKRISTLSELRQIYISRMRRDFAANELRPWASLRRSWNRGAYDCYGLFQGDALLGYACFLRLNGNGEAGDFYLFDYLAIAEEQRDQGLGSVFLRQLSACVKDAACILGEVEDPAAVEDPETRRLRERRLCFYLRNGYLKTGLSARVFGVAYQILEVPTGKPHTAEELRAVYAALYRDILPAALFRRCIHIHGI